MPCDPLREDGAAPELIGRRKVRNADRPCPVRDLLDDGGKNRQGAANAILNPQKT